VDQVFSEPIFRDFERQTGIKVRAVFDTEETKSTGVVNRIIAESSDPQADVFWSGDPVRQFLLLNRGLVEKYLSPNSLGIPV
jgi:iron(III) transport system substrate-binding protein